MLKALLQGACVVLLPAVIAACQSPTAVYEGTVNACAATDCAKDDEEVAKAAAKGSQVVNLPITRLTIAPAPQERSTERSGGSDDDKRGGGKGGGAGGGSGGGGGSGSGGGGDDQPAAKYAIKAAPVETNDYFRIRGDSGFWSDTNIQLTRIPNTDIVSSIQVDFRDDTPARIQQLFGLLSAVAGVAGVPIAGMYGEADAPKTDRCKDAGFAPFSVDVSSPQKLAELKTGLAFPDHGPYAGCWKLTLTPKTRAPQDVVNRASFVNKLRNGGKLKTFPYPACMNVDLRLVKIDEKGNESAKEVFEGETPIIDPSYLRLARLPEKGKIEMHPVCNANNSNAQTADPLKGYFDAISNVLGGLKPSDGSKPGGGKPK
jgi:hypothetical protein